MPAPTTPPVDAVSAAITLASAIVGPALGVVLGTYAVIVAAAVCGSLLSLRRREPGTRLQALWHVGVWAAISALLTVPLAELVGGYAGLRPLWLFAPVAVLISGVGDDWPGVAEWVKTAALSWRKGA